MKRHCFFVNPGFGVLVLLFLAGSIRVAMGQAQLTGQWTTLSNTMPINPIHAALLHTGKVLVVTGSGNNPPDVNNLRAAVFDPIAGTVSTPQSVPYDMFCNGMVVFSDGRPFIFGGTLKYLSNGNFDGISQTAVYDPSTGAFTTLQSMAHGRWYPTGTVLGDGRVMVFSGDNENDVNNNAVEIYTVGSGWSSQYIASWNPPNYPRLQLLPNGNVFYSGPTTSSALFNPATQTWTLNVAHTNYGLQRKYGSSVLLPLSPQNNYAPRVVILGGLDTSTGATTATTEIIDLSVSSPAWKYSAPMSQARVEMNAVLLPTGKILALGGSSVDEKATTASLNADLFDPVTQTIAAAGTEAYARLYHSVALLLPDATVWVAGSNPTQGNFESHMEIYQPAYLFTTNSSGQTVLATRPTISSAPSTTGYGSSFQVQTPDAATITSVVMMRAGAVTHAFDMEQRMVGLNFTVASGALTVTSPPNGNTAPPGYYMLFLVNNAGVPSKASFVQLVASSGSGGGIGFVQVAAATPATSMSTVSVPFASAQAVGNLNVAVVGWNDTTSSVQSVTDSNANAYTLAVGPIRGTNLSQSIYYSKNIASGSNTVTVKFSQAAAGVDVRALEYSGLDTVSPLDVVSSSSGTTGTAANSGSKTTTSANELIFGADTVFTGNAAPGPNFTTRIITSPDSDLAEDQVVSATGSYSAAATLTSSGPWVMQMATFKAAGSSGNPAPTVTAVSPNSGSVNGGTSVTITGTNFASGATVTFGGTAATNVTVVSGTSITATTPAYLAGAVSVVVTNSSGQSGTLSNGYTYTSSSPTIGFVQVTATNLSHGTYTTVALAYKSSQTAGDLNIVAVGWNDTTASIQSVADSRGNAYILAVGPSSGTALRQSIYYAKNIVAGSNTVTVTFSPGAADPDIRILEYKGVSTLDVAAGASGSSGSSTTVSSGSASSTAANELIFGAGITDGGFSGAGSGFTKEIITAQGDIAEDRVVSSTGSQSATAVLGAFGTQTWVMQMATFK